MAFLKQAFGGAFRVPWALVLYAAALILSSWLRLGVEYALETEALGEMSVAAENIIRLGRDLLLVVLAATITPIAFGLIGRDLARPLWKVGIPGEALRRFFSLWFIITLLVLTVLRITENLAAADSPLTGVMFSLSLVLYAASTVVGAAIMYHGRFATEEFAKALTPLVRDFGRTILLLLMALFQFFVVLFSGIQPEDLSWIWHAPMFSILSAVLECAVFSGAWIICMTSQETTDDDLDF